jgi:phosphotransferase system HPr (HPr) family protein
MKQRQLFVPWKQGLHLGPASRLVKLARASSSVVLLKVGDKVADARSILAMLLLCASCGMAVNLEIDGDDEDEVLASVVQVFESGHNGNRMV